MDYNNDYNAYVPGQNTNASPDGVGYTKGANNQGSTNTARAFATPKSVNRGVNNQASINNQASLHRAGTNPTSTNQRQIYIGSNSRASVNDMANDPGFGYQRSNTTGFIEPRSSCGFNTSSSSNTTSNGSFSNASPQNSARLNPRNPSFPIARPQPHGARAPTQVRSASSNGQGLTPYVTPQIRQADDEALDQPLQQRIKIEQGRDRPTPVKNEPKSESSPTLMDNGIYDQKPPLEAGPGTQLTPVDEEAVEATSMEIENLEKAFRFLRGDNIVTTSSLMNALNIIETRKFGRDPDSIATLINLFNKIQESPRPRQKK